MKRVFLLVLTNIAIMLVLSVAISVLGLDRYLYARGVNYTGLLMVSAIFGFGGAFISLAISKWMAKRARPFCRSAAGSIAAMLTPTGETSFAPSLRGRRGAESTSRRPLSRSTDSRAHRRTAGFRP